MERLTSPTQASVPRGSSNHDEFLMQQGLLFSDTLKDLKNLRKQLYTAAEYFEASYQKEEEKQIVVETSKDYAIKAFVNTVDHLGSIAFKVNSILDEKIGEISSVELRVSCVKQRLQTCKEFVNFGGLSQQALVTETPKHYKRYSFPEEILEDFPHTKLKQQSPLLSPRLDWHQLNAVQATAEETPAYSFGEELFILPSPQPSSRRGAFSFTSPISMKQKPDSRAISPHRFPPQRSGPLLQRSTTFTHSYSNVSNPKLRYPSEPRRTASLTTSASLAVGRGDSSKDMEHYSTKSKRLFRAMLSLRKSKKDVSVYQFLDGN